MKILLLLMSFLIFSCQSTEKNTAKKTSSNDKVSFAEFNKVLHPRSSILPLPGGKLSIMLMALPKDRYAKVYTLDHKTKKFALRFDAGRNISKLVRDYTKKNYYLFLDNNGDENFQIYSFDIGTNEIKKIFGHKEKKAEILDYSRDGKRLYLSSNHVNKKQYRVYRFNKDTGKIVELTDGKVSFYEGIVNADETYAAFSSVLGNNEQHVYLTNLKTGKTRKILSTKATKYMPAFFHPSKNELYLNSDYKSDRIGCAKIIMTRPSKLHWVKTDSKKDLECHFKEVDKISVVVETFDGRINVRLFTSVLGQEIVTPFPKKAIVSQFTLVPGSQKAIAKMVTANSPSEYYMFDLEDGTEKLTAISNLNRSAISKDSFAKSFDLYYKSFDGLGVHGIVYAKEEWLKSNEKHPVILWPHGGPDSQEFHIFHPFFQYWVLNGYVVLAPNFRGSTGYGKRFETLNDRDWGGAHIKDLIYGKRELAKLPYVDANRMFIVGASFGGFSTLSTITQYPDEFQGAVAIVALANLFTFMKSIPQDPAWQSEFLTEIGHPVKNKKFYRERSPYFHAKNIKIPLKIYQAENDIRTVKAEMDQFVDQLIKHKIPVQYEVLLKEGHGLARTESWEKVLGGTVAFLNQVKSQNSKIRGSRKEAGK